MSSNFSLWCVIVLEVKGLKVEDAMMFRMSMSPDKDGWGGRGGGVEDVCLAPGARQDIQVVWLPAPAPTCSRDQYFAENKKILDN